MWHSGWRNSARMQLPGSYILLAAGTPARCISNYQLITDLIHRTNTHPMLSNSNELQLVGIRSTPTWFWISQCASRSCPRINYDISKQFAECWNLQQLHLSRFDEHLLSRSYKLFWFFCFFSPLFEHCNPPNSPFLIYKSLRKGLEH
jgi:hypothetical protein